MSNLFGSQPKTIPEFTGLQVNTSVQSLPIPIIYGAPRVNVNLIYYNGFKAVLVKQQSGKGLLSGGKGAKSVEYFATIILAIGEGELGDVVIIYQNQDVWTPATFPSNGAFYYSGSPTQTPWGYIATYWPADARAYKDLAYYGFSNAQLDSGATVPQIDLVVKGILAGSSPLNNSTITISTGQYDPNGHPISFIGNIALGASDADPGQVIYDFLTNPVYGATFPAQWIDKSTLTASPLAYDPNTGDASLQAYCQAVGLAWSTVLNNVESASARLERWTKNLNVAPVWNGALLRFVPYWDQPASQNPGWSGTLPKLYFSPYTVPIVQITLDQILQSEQKDADPITFTRKDPQEVYNTVRLDFRDRNNFFNNVPVEQKDEAHIELYGPRIDNIGSADEFTLNSYAQVAAQMLLRRNISIMRSFKWRMSPLWGWLDPMDILSIPDPVNYNNSIVVRVTSVEDDADETVVIQAEEYPVGVQSPTVLPAPSTTPPNQAATNNPPASIYKPVMFAATTAMYTAQGFATPQFIFGCSAGYDGTLDENWGGAEIWVSLDNSTYQLIGTIYGPAVVGSLTVNLGGYNGVNPEATAMHVNILQSGGALSSFPASAAAGGASLCVLMDASGFELLSYETATFGGNGAYSLTTLYRGLYGTYPRYFGAGSQFMFIGPSANFFETNLPAAYVGQRFWVKAQSFNSFNNVSQDLDSVMAYQYVPTSPNPGPPDGSLVSAANKPRLSVFGGGVVRSKPRRL